MFRFPAKKNISLTSCSNDVESTCLLSLTCIHVASLRVKETWVERNATATRALSVHMKKMKMNQRNLWCISSMKWHVVGPGKCRKLYQRKSTRPCVSTTSHCGQKQKFDPSFHCSSNVLDSPFRSSYAISKPLRPSSTYIDTLPYPHQAFNQFKIKSPLC